MADQDPQQPVVANDESLQAVKDAGIQHPPADTSPDDAGEDSDVVGGIIGYLAGVGFGPVGGAIGAHLGMLVEDNVFDPVENFVNKVNLVRDGTKLNSGPATPIVTFKRTDQDPAGEATGVKGRIEAGASDIADIGILSPDGVVETPRGDEISRIFQEIDDLDRVPRAPDAKFFDEPTAEDRMRVYENVFGKGRETGSDDTNLNAVSPFDPTGAKGGARSGYAPGQGGSNSDTGGSDSGGGSDPSNGNTTSDTDETTSGDPFSEDTESAEEDPPADRGEGGSGTVGHSPVEDTPSGDEEGDPDEEGDQDGGGGSGSSGGSGTEGDSSEIIEDSGARRVDGTWVDENGNELPPDEAAEREKEYQESQSQSGEGEGGEDTPGVSTTPIDEESVDPVLQEQLNAELQKLRDAQGARLGDNGATDPSEDSGFDVPSDVALSDLPTKVDWVGNPTGVETNNGPVAGGVPAPGYTSSHGTGVIHQDAPVQTTGPDERGQDVIPGGFGSGARGNGTPPDAAPDATLQPELRGVTVDDPLHGARPVATGTDHYYAVAPSGGTTGAGSSDASNSDTSFGTGSQDNTAATPSSSPVVDSPYDNVPEPLHEVQPGLARSGGMDIDGGQYQATPAGGATDYGDGNDADTADDTGASPFAPPVVDSPYDDVPDEVTYDPTN